MRARALLSGCVHVKDGGALIQSLLVKTSEQASRAEFTEDNNFP